MSSADGSYPEAALPEHHRVQQHVILALYPESPFALNLLTCSGMLRCLDLRMAAYPMTKHCDPWLPAESNPCSLRLQFVCHLCLCFAIGSSQFGGVLAAGCSLFRVAPPGTSQHVLVMGCGRLCFHWSRPPVPYYHS